MLAHDELEVLAHSTAREAQRSEARAKVVTERVLLVHREGVTIEWDVRLPGVVSRFHGPVVGDAYRATLDEHLGFAQARGARKLMADVRECAPIPFPEQRWTLERWFMQAVYAGVRQLAFVLPPSAPRAFAPLLRGLGETRLETACFDSPTAAVAWLREQR